MMSDRITDTLSQMSSSIKADDSSDVLNDLTHEGLTPSATKSEVKVESVVEPDDLFNSLNSEYTQIRPNSSIDNSNQDVLDFENELRVLGAAINNTQSDMPSRGASGIKRERTVSSSSATPPNKRRKESVSGEANHEDEKTAEDPTQSSAKSKKQQQEEERLKMQLLVSNFSEDQLNRYEMYRRAAFPKAAIKRLMQSISSTTVSQSVVIAMSGIAKVFVGEIVESALDVMEKQNVSGPLQPKHIREAVRQMRLKNGVPTTKHKKILFK